MYNLPSGPSVPRLQAAGADPNRIIIHEMTTQADGGEKEFGLDTDLPALLDAFNENPNIKLVIIDPTSAHFGEINENRTQEVRSALAALKRIIESKKIAVILVTHYNKMKEATEHLDRIAGLRGHLKSGHAWSVQNRPCRNTARDAARQPLSLAEQIERRDCALTADELSRTLNVSKITIFKQAKAGRIPSFRIGTCVRFDPTAVAQWLRSM